jgi:hypothetical protein
MNTFPTNRNRIPCGSGLARDSGLSASINVECPTVIASRLAPTGGPCRSQIVRHTSINCGSEPARDSNLSASINVECPTVIASRLAPTGDLRRSHMRWV